MEAAWVATLRRMQAAFGKPQDAEAPFEVAYHRDNGQYRCGDLCDLIQLDDARCVLVILDAGGGGVAALSQAEAMLTAIRAVIPAAEDPTDLAPIMNRLNQTVSGRTDRQLVTCTLLAVDVTAGRIAYINAGGLPPLLLAGPGRLITLDQSALLLGIDAEYSYDTATVDLPPSFRLVCYSDGLTNASNASGDTYGEQRLHELLLDRDSFTEPAALVQKVTDAVSTHLAGHGRDDDATLLVLSRG
jgi:sigma-B regulation protein RsbU (phosphoserine phosphatase)